MKEETRIKTLRTFYYFGMVLFANGIVLVFVYNRIYAVGIMSIGIMWSFIGYKSLKDAKSK